MNSDEPGNGDGGESLYGDLAMKTGMMLMLIKMKLLLVMATMWCEW